VINLPSPPRLAFLKSFWLVICIGSGMFVGALVSLLVSTRWGIMVAAAAALVAWLGLLRPQIAATPYRIWNKLARTFARYARGWLLLICFYVVFLGVGRAGSPIRLLPPIASKSLWVPWEIHAAGVQESCRGVIEENGLPRGWVLPFIRWATRTRNWWAYCLVPFLALLSVLDTEGEESAFPAGIYTLF
jgi:hypothetical protein